MSQSLYVFNSKLSALSFSLFSNLTTLQETAKKLFGIQWLLEATMFSHVRRYNLDVFNPDFF